jgi:hypothetical protein
MQEFVDTVVAFLTKLGTVLVDRRALITAGVYGLLGLLGLFGYTADAIDQLKQLFDTAYGGVINLNDAVLLLVSVVSGVLTIIAPLLGLLASWAKRAPSGLAEFRPNKR